MKLFVVAFLAAAVLGFNFNLPEVKQAVRADSGEDLPFADQLSALTQSFSEGNFKGLLVRGMSLLRDLKATFTGNSKCPYKRCVKRRLHKAGKIAKYFVCALFRGHTKKAQKVLKCLHKALYNATLCKKKK
jgi:hypothetical protein